MGVTSQVSEMMKKDAEIRQRIMAMYVCMFAGFCVMTEYVMQML